MTTIDNMTEEKKGKGNEHVKALAEKHGGTITPEIILADAKRKRSPLHKFFCWDDSVAANKYRHSQAMEMIRRIKVTIHAADNRSVRVRAYVNVHETDETEDQDEIGGHGINARPRGIYVDFQTAMQVESYHDQVMAQCKRDVEAFRSKYSAITQASKIIDAMDDFTAKLELK